MQFPKFIKFGDMIGADSISGTFVAEESYKKNNEINIEKCDENNIKKLVEEIKLIKKDIKANIEVDEIIEYTKTWKIKREDWSKIPCYKPWYSPFITWEGNLNSCCYSVDNNIILGNLATESFEKVWNGKKMRIFREMVRKNRCGLCARCGSDETYIKNQFERIPFLKPFVR